MSYELAGWAKLAANIELFHIANGATEDNSAAAIVKRELQRNMRQAFGVYEKRRQAIILASK